ncbi:MAG: hypothetical protein COU42_01025 [Candidatus Nealsonbacteria bacterium CG10_big_fil_rev_8_21_14_0_10_36_24]|uniref:Endolytic murein transglycosylase n=1 Tax=Candidatus Nealsonbacteria bacterium CG10_big_fil_rev_8_21_14_0_10_36_24 TaxID=1974710 RepID=A0A2M6NSA7_9BACT|nr:MAG: hypothetical protein COU42_01025 [Candidatus Nealsonbacteria bacterium CG10_big_fil_rev_8_21_14_0_10_36_24]
MGEKFMEISNGVKYIFVFIIIVVLSLFLLWFGIYVPKTPGSDETVIFLVKKGEGAKEISLNLKEQELIRYSSLFRFYALFYDKADKLKAGEYELSSSMNIPEIVNKMTEGDRVKKIITIIEGWTVKDIEEYLGEKIDPGLEGYLFPDTYEIFPEDGIEEIIERMLANFDKKVRSQFQEEIGPEIITIASLLEKEVRTSEDKKIVSGILWKRLEIGMPLQVDAAPDTYKYKGLSPGPICNPGLESIEAAIYPQESPYLYYLSTPDGETIFSQTLKEHNIAREKYLK